MLKSVFNIAVLTAAVATSAAAQDGLEVVAESNSLPYSVKDPAVKAAWEGTEVYGRTLIQGAKVDRQGSIYVSTARWGGAEIPSTVSKLVRNGDIWELEAYPSEELKNMANPDGLKAVLGFEIDRNDVMWILDQGHVAGPPFEDGDAKLILWDIRENREIQRYVFGAKEADRQCSFLTDLAVDNDTGFAYIADSGIFCDPLRGGLLVYDSNTNTARRILDDHKYTNNEPNFFFNIDDRQVVKNGGMQTGADGITLSGDKETPCWTNLTGNKLYSLPTEILRNFETSLPSNTDGMTADNAGNVYMTALSLDGIMKFDESTGQVSRFVHHPEMNCPDTLAWGPDGEMYVVSNHLHVWVDGDMNFDNPDIPNFRIWKIPCVGRSYTTE